MQHHFSLKSLNTFGLDVYAKHYFSLLDIQQLTDLNNISDFRTNRLILGGGSNVLFTKDFDGLVIHNELKGKKIVFEDDNIVQLKVAAGENWHELVLFTIENNWGGIENLSLIPGKVGASPMQNIGAYGVELKDVFLELEAWNIQKQQIEVFDKAKCEFGYRESIFKNSAKDQYIILSVTLELQKHPKINIAYGAIEAVLNSKKISSPSIKDVSDAVIEIRQSKLPNPTVIGNAGSFFKNPYISKTQYLQLQKEYPTIPSYPVDDLTVKVPAGWLIDQAGWKGKRFGDYGVHKNQALVLVNYGSAKGQDIAHLAAKIQMDILKKYQIELQTEVNFY